MKEFFSRVAYQIQGPSGESALRIFTCINLIFLFLRPQAVIPGLASVRPVMVLSIAMAPFVLAHSQRLRGAQVWAFLGFIIIGAPGILLAANNAWAFASVKGLLQIFSIAVLPIICFYANGSGMKFLIRITLLAGFYLGLYGATHRGFGPGGFLGDENDLCNVLVLFLALPLFLLPHSKKTIEKLMLLAVIATILVGVVATNSRGGFLGLVAVFIGVFIHSSRKLAMIIIGLVLGLSSLFFVPQSYWDEMSTISQTDQGTAQGRKDIWKVAIAVWLHPPYIIAGSGMNNVKFHLHRFEPAKNKSSSGRSIGGRAVHNTYIQLLADVGIIGFALFLLLSISSYRGNTKCKKMLNSHQKMLERIQFEIKQGTSSVLRSESKEDAETLEQQVVPAMYKELDQSKVLLEAWNAAWLGVLVSMTFIDILYYPTLWFLAGSSLAIQNHAKSMMMLTDQLKEQIGLSAQPAKI